MPNNCSLLIRRAFCQGSGWEGGREGGNERGLQGRSTATRERAAGREGARPLRGAIGMMEGGREGVRDRRCPRARKPSARVAGPGPGWSGRITV